MAEEVLVLAESGTELGLVSLEEKNGRGDIRLLAVDATARGRSIGTTLVVVATAFTNRGLQHGQLVTQRRNISACRLYKKCGFNKE